MVFRSDFLPSYRGGESLDSNTPIVTSSFLATDRSKIKKSVFFFFFISETNDAHRSTYRKRQRLSPIIRESVKAALDTQTEKNVAQLLFCFRRFHPRDILTVRGRAFIPQRGGIRGKNTSSQIC